MKTSTYIKSLITRHGVDGAVSYLKSSILSIIP